jgi:hypothetical protein
MWGQSKGYGKEFSCLGNDGGEDDWLDLGLCKAYSRDSYRRVHQL